MNENNAWLLLGLAAVLTGIAGAAIVVGELSKGEL